MNRQRLILVILLALFAVAVVYAVIRFPRQKQVEKLTYRPGAMAAAPRGAVVATDNRVRLDLLQRDQLAFTGFKKNIFAPLFRDKSKLALLPVPPPPPPPPPPKPVVPSVVAPPGPPPEVRELAQFTFLGFLEKDRKKTIFLAKDKEIFLVKRGDRIAGKYEATAITDEALSIKVSDSPNEIIIPLVENRALKPIGAGSGAQRGRMPLPRRPMAVPPVPTEMETVPIAPPVVSEPE